MGGKARLAGCVVLIVALAALPACKRTATVEPPPRAEDGIENPVETSSIAVPIEADARFLHAALERAVPRALWTIDRRFDRCVPPQRVKVLGQKITLKPKIGCRIVGQVTRGAIRLTGRGDTIIAELPIHARISARDVGGVIKQETATGAAVARAHIRLGLTPEWNPQGKVDLSYGWTRPPGIDFLGQRITFTDEADAKLRPIVRELERTLPRELAKLGLRRQIEQAWQQAFTVLELNGTNPPVWMKVTPRQLSYGGFTMADGKLRFRMGMEALTETFVGEKPAAPQPVPLPRMARLDGESGLRFFIPVIADYAELEPVVERALAKRAQRPFEVPRVGPIVARFEDATVYGTNGGRIAVGIRLAARPRAMKVEETKGQVWITALPVNAPNSRTVEFRDLKVGGMTDGVAGNLLIELANSPEIAQTIADSLTQNFTRDYEGLLAKVRVALVDKRQGAFRIATTLDHVETGTLRAAGQGLYLPVRASGGARIDYRPLGRQVSR